MEEMVEKGEIKRRNGKSVLLDLEKTALTPI